MSELSRWHLTFIQGKPKISPSKQIPKRFHISWELHLLRVSAQVHARCVKLGGVTNSAIRRIKRTGVTSPRGSDETGCLLTTLLKPSLKMPSICCKFWCYNRKLNGGGWMICNFSNIYVHFIVLYKLSYFVYYYCI